jgi:hypothetical protein
MNKLSRTLNQVIFWSLIIATIVLVITSLIVRDYYFIVEHPWLFVWELLCFSVIPSLLIVFVMAKTRSISVKDVFKWLIAMIIKFAVFHILFQLSGVYTVIMAPKI